MWKLYTHCSSFTLMVCMACIKSRKNCTIFYRKSFRENICLQKQLLYLCAKTNITSSQRFIMFFLSEEEAVCQWKNWLSFWRNWWNLLRRCQGKPFVAKVQHFHFTKSQIQTGCSEDRINGFHRVLQSNNNNPQISTLKLVKILV